MPSDDEIFVQICGLAEKEFVDNPQEIFDLVGISNLDKSLILDYISGDYTISDLDRKYFNTCKRAYYLIHKVLSIDTINKVESKSGRRTKNMFNVYLDKIESDIINDYKSGKYYQLELAKKYNVSVNTIYRLIHRKLSESEIHYLMCKTKCIYSVELCKRIVDDYRTRNYYLFELARIYNMPYSSVSPIICKYIDKLERLEIQNYQHNRDFDGSESEWRRFGIYKTVFSEKCKCEVGFRGSLERKTILFLENDENVKFYSYEPLRITYGEGRTYIPDFIVEYIDGKIILIEVKPDIEVELPINKLKFKAAREYCLANSLEFVVVTDIYLNSNSSLNLVGLNENRR